MAATSPPTGSTRDRLSRASTPLGPGTTTQTEHHEQTGSTLQISVNTEGIDLNTVIATTGRYDEDGDFVGEQQTTIGEAVIEKTVSKLMQKVARGDEWAGVRKRIQDIRDEEIRALVSPLIEEAITAPVQKTNLYGEVTGGSTTLREIIVKTARETLKENVGTYRDSQTFLQKVVADEVKGAFKQEISAAIAEEKEKAVAAVRASAATIIADAIKQGIGR